MNESIVQDSFFISHYFHKNLRHTCKFRDKSVSVTTGFWKKINHYERKDVIQTINLESPPFFTEY